MPMTLVWKAEGASTPRPKQEQETLKQLLSLAITARNIPVENSVHNTSHSTGTDTGTDAGTGTGISVES